MSKSSERFEKSNMKPYTEGSNWYTFEKKIRIIVSQNELADSIVKRD
jgi:hypothetical protein